MNKKEVKIKIEKIEKKILNTENYLNKKKSKINSKENYEDFLNEIKDFPDEGLDKMLDIFKTKEIIPVLKVLINGFIDFNFDEKNQETILKVISRIINIKYKNDKVLFIMIYKKLSKIFRKHSNIKNIKSIIKFDKLFTVWKLLYNMQYITLNQQNNNDNLKNKNKKNIKINERNNEEYKDISEIEYFGGFDCLIPLFKIIKYIIVVLGDLKSKNSNNENENENKQNLELVDYYLDRSLTWIKDIFNIILNLIFLSESNYLYFTKIVIPLIGALYEVAYSLPSDYKIKIFKEKISYAFFIIIINYEGPNNILSMYQQLFENFNLDNFASLQDSINFNLEEINANNIYWHFLIILNFLEFINLIPFQANKEITLILIDKLENLYKLNKKYNKPNNITSEEYEFLISLFKIDKKEDIKKKISKISKDSIKNKLFLKILISLIKKYLNVKRFLKIINIEFNENIYFYKLPEILQIYISKINGQETLTEEIKMEIKNAFKYYCNDIQIIEFIFPFLKGEEEFITQSEFLMNELIDYQGQYHHLMKELFIFNRIWSNKKLFFKDSLEKRELPNIKYKNINYYTKNFQRPIIYPVLDYKYRYPEFSKYKIGKGFYSIEDTEDDYNFDLDCEQLDNLIEEYNEKIFKEIQSESEIEKYKVCLVKQNYHIKGNLFIVKTNRKLIIYFYGYPYNFSDIIPDSSTCNKKINLNSNNMNDLCYGSLFKSPKKEKNKKIIINFNNIRLILKRIYYYRKSALEIFTQTKSYYFNLSDEESLNRIINILDYKFQKSFLPIKIKDNIIGYIKANLKGIKENHKNFEMSNFDFLDFISNKTSNGEFCEMCIFDIIILLNLISNRSYIDMYQYPVFPLLNFYNKSGKYISRDFQEHIGFQSKSEECRKRKKRFEELYKNEKQENEEEEENEDEGEGDPTNQTSYFNTRYSNIVYASNFMVRLFPYSFSCIELQGDGFDNPNRLFFAIENTFYNISSQQSDLRELIPEFFYLPEMLMNINCINFGKRNNGEKVSNVIIPTKFPVIKNKDNNLNDDDNNDNDNDNNEDKKMNEGKNSISKSKTINNINSNNEEKLQIDKESENNDINDIKSKIDDIKENKNNIIDYFIFVDYLKSRLENLNSDFGCWINLIFGDKQRYKIIKNGEGKGQYFKTESFIDVDKKTFEKYTKQELIMTSVEFGLIPLQSITNKMTLENFKKRRNVYGIEGYKNVYIRKNKPNLENGNNSPKKKSKKEKEKEKLEEQLKKNCIPESYYWDKTLIISFENDNFGKLKVFENSFLIKEIVDHNKKIIDVFFNQRLNIFATTSIDGLICIYFLPCKLISIIKHPEKKYYDKVLVSANPFPTIVTYEKENDLFRSYSISGLLIKEKKIIIENENKHKKKIENKKNKKNNNENNQNNEKGLYKINILFDCYGGNFKDRLIVFNKEYVIEYSLPFFKEIRGSFFD